MTFERVPLMTNQKYAINKYRLKKLYRHLIDRLGRVKIIVQKKKKVTLVFLSILFLAFSAGTVWSFTASAEEEIEITNYYYTQEAILDYRVYLAPNDLFDSQILKPGMAYITSITDKIVVNLEYLFFGEDDAEISGYYNVNASLLAHTAQKEHLVWEKNFVLLRDTKFNSTDADYWINDQFTIPVADYVKFAEKAREQTGYNPAELNLIINCNINLEALTEKGLISENLSPNMIIPLQGNTFTVGGELIDKREGGIKEVAVIGGLEGNNPTTVLAFFTVMTALALTLVGFFIVPDEGKVKQKKQRISHIVKKHKERIVITSNGVSALPNGVVTTYSFDELLKLADEVNKPILYFKSKVEEDNNEHVFLIYTPEQTYAYKVAE